MSKKSERSHLSRSKRKKSGIGPPPRAVVQTGPVVPAAVATPHAEVPAPVSSAAGKRMATVEGHFPSVLAEIKRIGILAGIILAVLAVLAVVLP